MITHFKVHCRSFVWYLVAAFTICSIPHFEMLPAELAGMLGREAHAAQTPSSSCPVHEYVYDARGRVVTERQHLANGIATTQYVYSGFSTTKTDPEGRMKTETRDYLGRMVRAEETFESRVLRIAYAYNAAGDFLSMTDGNGNLVKQTDPTGHSVKDKKVMMLLGESSLDGSNQSKIKIILCATIGSIIGIILIIGTIILAVGIYSDYVLVPRLLADFISHLPPCVSKLL